MVRESFMKSLEKNMGKLPHTVQKAFQGIRLSKEGSLHTSKKIFLESIEASIKKRPKDKMERYFVLARLVFSYINFLYELMESTRMKDRFRFFLGRENYLTGNIYSLFFESIEIFTGNLPEGYSTDEIAGDEILKYYDVVFSMLMDKHPEMEKLAFTKTHFKSKIDRGAHHLFSRHVLESHELAFGNMHEVSPVLVILESVVHGIDDYVDVQKQVHEKYFSDVANIVIGLFGILLYITSRQQKDFYDNISSFFGKNTKTERILESLKESLVELTWTPFVERDVVKILGARTDEEEYGLAVRNLEARTRGTTKTLTGPIKILLGLKTRDASEIAKLVWILRVEQMLSKDIADIEADLENKDYKAPTVWAKKYKRGTEDFNRRVMYLNDLYYKKSIVIMRAVGKKYPESVEFLMKEITKIHDELNKNLGRA